MKKVLVTGATGFVGSKALPLLANRFDEVHAVSRRAEGDAGGVRWRRADLLDERESAALIETVRPTHLLHLAWFVEPGTFWTSDENSRWVEASIALARRFADCGGQRLVAAGTCAEYDWMAGGVCSERRTPLAPSSAYGAAKHALHAELEQIAGKGGLAVGWGRIFFLFGPGEHPDRLVSSVIRRLLSGERAPTTEGSQVRDFLYVEDVADAFVSLLDSGVRGAVNIGSGRPISVREVVLSIAGRLSRADLLDCGALPTPANEPPLLVADVGRLANEVRWAPRFTLESGLDQTIEWWKSRISGGCL
ncbi:MAG TPA: NAD(P)-dependent oxidoreductase [Thermoanaerobaculia bacterium]|nr:NAD(P)-dependent oxidoreductase [Thermoanaerobaculia bacterium]